MEAEYCGDGIMGLLANNSLSGSDKKLLNPELLNPADPDSPELILHGFSFVGGEEYYLKIGNEFRVYALSENRQISSWAIDTDEAGPRYLPSNWIGVLAKEKYYGLDLCPGELKCWEVMILTFQRYV